MIKKLPKLGYEYDALEPYIDGETMRLHREKHHQGYLDKLNKLLEGYPELADLPAEELIKNPEEIPKSVRVKVLQNAGQFVNHNLFFSVLKKDTKIEGELLNVIERDFGSFETFRSEFLDEALGLFGSGWIWLIVNTKGLEILSTANHENPLMLKAPLVPILNLDMWEHAYYLKYRNEKKNYIEGFFKVINWDRVGELYLETFHNRR